MRKIIIYLYLLTMIYALFEQMEHHLLLPNEQKSERSGWSLNEHDISTKDSLLSVHVNKVQHDGMKSELKCLMPSYDKTYQYPFLSPLKADSTCQCHAFFPFVSRDDVRGCKAPLIDRN